MPIALDTQTNLSYNGTKTSSHNFSHNGGSGSDRCTVFSVYTVDANVTTTLTFDGVSATFVGRAKRGDASVNRYMHLFYLEGSATGVNTANISCSPISRVAFGAVTYTGVDQTTPIDDSAATEYATAASWDMTLNASQSGGVATGVLGSIGINTAADLIAGTNAQILDQRDIDAMVAGADTPISSAGDYTMTWSAPSSSAAGIVMVMLRAVDGGGGGAFTKPNYLGFSRL